MDVGGGNGGGAGRTRDKLGATLVLTVSQLGRQQRVDRKCYYGIHCLGALYCHQWVCLLPSSYEASGRKRLWYDLPHMHTDTLMYKDIKKRKVLFLKQKSCCVIGFNRYCFNEILWIQRLNSNSWPFFCAVMWFSSFHTGNCCRDSRIGYGQNKKKEKKEKRRRKRCIFTNMQPGIW